MSDMSEYLQIFLDETGEQLDSLVEKLLILEREPGRVEELNEVFRLIHSIKGAAGTMGFDNITVLSHHLESRFETFRSGLAGLDEPTMNLVLQCVDFLRECVRRLHDGEQLGSPSELLEKLEVLGEQATQAPPKPAPDPQPGSAPEAPGDQATPVAVEPEPASQTQEQEAAGDRSRSKSTETMRVGIDRLDSLLNLAGELMVNRVRFFQIASQVGPAFRRRNLVPRVREFGESLRRTVEHLQNISDSNNDLTRDIKELRAGLSLIEEQNELWSRGREGFALISEAIDQLTRISDSLQQRVLDTRMVPVGPLFNRFKRVVRDISTERGKKVSLSILGEKTELDKRMIDELGEPLIHLVRNSIDHGIEPPDVRLSRGKSEEGTIFLEASHGGSNVFIVIRDDGGGIDVARIKERLAERGLLAQAAIAELSDEQVLEYIWHPGFSTTSEVTDISGRGVGTDAVRARIGELNGTIDVESVPEHGTTFTIRLPLTLAIINSLLIRVRGVLFSIPINDVREIVRIRVADVRTVRGQQTIDVRGEFLPLIGITDVFRWHDINYASSAAPPPEVSNDGNSVDAVILQAGDRAMALQVEELLGSQEIVIKSLSTTTFKSAGCPAPALLAMARCA